jgi:hypothetical protein
MSQRDVIIFYSNQLNASYVTTNKGYMNKSYQALVTDFKKNKSKIGDDDNSNYKERPNLISVIDIGTAIDFKVEVRKKQGLANSAELNLAKKSAVSDYANKKYISTNGIR